MAQFFDFLESNQYQVLISLVELHEFDDYISLANFKKNVGQRNFDWYHHPLKDMTAPDEAFMNDFSGTRSSLIDYLRSGEKIAVHCKGGLGRSGTVAAMLMCNIGFDAVGSIEAVRMSRPGAIETAEQEMFIKSQSS
jgi:protein-tyrosine phosphatase